MGPIWIRSRGETAFGCRRAFRASTRRGASPPDPPGYFRNNEGGAALTLTGGYSHSMVPGGFEVMS